MCCGSTDSISVFISIVISSIIAVPELGLTAQLLRGDRTSQHCQCVKFETSDETNAILKNFCVPVF